MVPSNKSFRQFVLSISSKIRYKEIDFSKYDDNYWQLMEGLTYAVYVPYHLDILYRKDLWEFLRSYYSFYYDFVWELFIWRSSIQFYLTLHDLDFFKLTYLEGIRSASFDSYFFPQLYEDIVFSMNHPLEVKPPLFDKRNLETIIYNKVEWFFQFVFFFFFFKSFFVFFGFCFNLFVFLF